MHLCKQGDSGNKSLELRNQKEKCVGVENII